MRSPRHRFGTREARRALWFCGANHAYVHLIELAWPVIVVFLRNDFGWTYTEAFLFATVPGVLFGLGALPGGILADKFGSFKVLRASNLVAALGALCVFFTYNPWLLVAEAGIIAFSTSFFHPASLSAVSSLFKENRGKALGLHGVAGSLGQYMAPVLVGVSIALFSGEWRYVALVWGAYGLALVIWGKGFSAQRPDEVAEQKHNIGYREASRHVLAFLPMMIMLLFIVRGFYYRGVQVPLSMVYSDVYGITGFWMAMATSMLFISAFPGHLLGGWATDRWGSSKSILRFTALSALASLVLVLARDPFVFTLGIMLFGFSFFATQPSTNAIVAEVTMKNIRGLFYGLSFVTRFGVAFAAVIFLGHVGDTQGLQAIFPWVLGFAILATCAAYVIVGVVRKRGVG
ncbi:MAG: MFS transporter [Thermoplasmata archaeon]|nr:MFS transporter [Thermoplasmata archaeon]